MNTPVSFPIAKLLKEKGFDINVGTAFKYTFEEGHIEDEYMDVASWNDISGVILAPTIAEIVMWLYEKHRIWVMVEMVGSKRFYPRGRMIDKEGRHFVGDFKDEKGERLLYNSPTEAYEAAIEYALKNLI